MRKGNEGFTLVELMAGIVCVTLVMGAVMSMMLMGQRTNRALNDAVSEQQTARIITTMLEDLASEGCISRVEITVDESGKQFGWELMDDSDNVILSYSNNQIKTRDDAVLMDGVGESTLTLSEANRTINGRLLTFTISTQEETYKTSVLSRVGASTLKHTVNTDNIIVEDFGDGESKPEEVTVGKGSGTETGEINVSASRFELLKVLCKQFGSTGLISGTDDTFSKWYCGGTYWSGWNPNTPWCGCFLSWGVNEVNKISGTEVIQNFEKFANVDKGKEYFASMNKWYSRGDTGYTITPGDFIFFSWDGDTATLEHVGAVFAVNGNYVYTIEGNSGGKVALHRYNINDARIIGYGVLDWA